LVLDITILAITSAPLETASLQPEHYPNGRRPCRGDRRGCLAKRERNDGDAKSRLV
jgi:hypothetical protein